MRRPLLLCYLEGRTRDEAAAELGWSPGALKGHLERGRNLLRNRLARRGVSLVVGLSLLGRPAARAAVPARLLDSVVTMANPSTAPGAAVPAAVARLAHGASAMRPTRSLIAAGLLALGLLTAGTALPGRATDPPGAMPAKPAAGPANPGATVPAGPITISGRVLGPDGKPADGATLHWWTGKAKSPADAPARATAGPDGRFTLTLTAADRSVPGRVVARSKGLAPDWGDVPAAGGELTLRLVRDDVPVEGRILDLEGKPVAGATVRVERVSRPAGGDLSDWLVQNVEKEKRGFYHTDDGLSVTRPELFDAPTTVPVGPDGRFRLAGYGRERLVAMEVKAPGMEVAHFRSATRNGPAQGYIPGKWGLYAATFDWLVTPAKPITGTVRDKHTGKPLAGIAVMDFLNYSRGVTDEAGRYRLDGVGKRGEYMVVTGGDKDRPYFDVTAMVKDTAGLEPIVVDFAMESGVVVNGRLTIKATGQPVTGHVSAFTPPDNPNLKDYTTLAGARAFISNWGRVGPDGRFSLLVVPGPNVVTAGADDENAFAMIDAEKELRKSRINSYPSGATHAVLTINPVSDDPKSLVCDIALEPGRTLTGTLVGPDGRPVTGVHAAGLGAPDHHIGPPLMKGTHRPPLKDAAFTAHGLQPGRSRAVVFYAAESKLGKIERLSADAAGPVTVRLEPLGGATGRVLDAQGRPMAGLTVTAHFSPGGPEADGLPWTELMQNGLYGLLLREVSTDREGRFRIEGLLPGLRYELTVAQGKIGEGAAAVHRTDLAPEAGKDRDLGDVTAKP
jgi:protocatechuate 3,4-dioxygenase beta subunit